MYELIDIDNMDSKGVNFVGKVNSFSFDGSVFIFDGIRSSNVESITKSGYQLTVQTKNSKYVFIEVI